MNEQMTFSRDYVEWLDGQRERWLEEYRKEVKMCTNAGFYLEVIYCMIVNHAKLDVPCSYLEKAVKDLLAGADLAEMRGRFGIDLNYKGE